MITYSVTISLILVIFFTILQLYFFADTRKHRKIFSNFFDRKQEYSSYTLQSDTDPYPQLNYPGDKDSDFSRLIYEINQYLAKTKGTSDYEFIHNKIERKLNMLYDKSTVYQSFPTYLGLMGTFAGVFLGILMFLIGFDSATKSISDEAIKNLLDGVLVSMFTSLFGLILTTYNNAQAGKARKKIEDDKNEFFDFIQTDVTKTASASLVTAISRLHDTVDKFEPAFTSVIEGFKEAFNECTEAFGEDFKENVDAVTDAVEVMGENMDKINENIDLQKQLIKEIKGNALAKSLEQYVNAANHFVGITKSLDKFEEARRMMLAAAQEAITLQHNYNSALQIPREVAVRVNDILDRIKEFEKSINNIAPALARRDMLGNEAINMIENTINAISKKGKIADRFIGIADGKLEDLYNQQTAAIEEMNKRYREAIASHIDGFEVMLDKQTKELERRHADFLKAIEERFEVEEIRKEFTNLKRLEAIEGQIKKIADGSVKPSDIQEEIKKLQKELEEIRKNMQEQKSSSEGKGGLFGWGTKK